MSKDELQVENGNFTRIINPLLEQLIQIPFKGCELATALFIIRKTYGYNKPNDKISLTQFEKALKRTRPTIVKALKNLQLVNVVKLIKRGNIYNSANLWKINKYYETWGVVNTAKLVKGRRKPSKDGLTTPSKDGLTYKRQYIKDIKDNTQSKIATNNKTMFKEEIIHLDESGEEIPTPSKSKFPNNLVKEVSHYFLGVFNCPITKGVFFGHKPVIEEMVILCRKKYGENNDMVVKEIKAKIDIAKERCKKEGWKKIKLSTILENWNNEKKQTLNPDLYE